MFTISIKNFFNSIGILTLDNLTKALSSFIVMILIINNVSTSDFSNLTLSIRSYGIISVFVLFGLENIILADFIRKNFLTFYISLRLRLLTSFVMMTLIMLFLFFANFYLNHDPIFIFIGVICFTLFIDAFLGLKELLFSKKLYISIFWSNLISSIVQICTVGIIILMNGSGVILLLPFIFSRLTAIIFYFLFSYNQIPEIKNIKHKKNINFNAIYTLLLQGFPLMLASVLGLIYAIQDQWMISLLIGRNEIAQYAAGINIVLAFIFVPSMISNLLFNDIINNINRPEKLRGFYSLMFFCGVILFILLYLSSGIITKTLFPDEYSNSSVIIQIFSIVLLTSFFGSLNNKILILRGQSYIIFWRSIFALILNCVLNLILIKKMGINGAAFSTVITEIVILISYYFFHKTRDLFYYQILAFDIRALCVFVKLKLSQKEYD